MVERTAAEPAANIRVRGEIYAELRKIAEKRDCTLGQALDFLIDRRANLERANDSKPDKGRTKQPKKWVGGIEGLVEG